MFTAKGGLLFIAIKPGFVIQHTFETNRTEITLLISLCGLSWATYSATIMQLKCFSVQELIKFCRSRKFERTAVFTINCRPLFIVVIDRSVKITATFVPTMARAMFSCRYIEFN